MKISSGYMCKKCNKIYHKSKENLPQYCICCGEDLIKERYSYNLIEYRGDVVETKSANMFGGYDYIKTTLTDNVEQIKLRRKLFGWELFKE